MKKKRRNRKSSVLLVSLLLMLSITLVGVIAFLTDKTTGITNTFNASEVPNEIIETLEGNVKKDVAIANTGDIPAYIRAMVMINWVNDAGDIYAENPKQADYEISWTMDGWSKGRDGFYYYNKPVELDNPETDQKENVTGVLFTDCKVSENADIPEGYYLTVEIMSQSIQADGGSDVNGTFTPAVTQAWGINVKTDGTLDVPSTN